MKHSIEQLQSRDETLASDNVTCDNVLTFDDESDTKEEEEKEDEQEADVSLLEKPSAPQIREALNSLFNSLLITDNKEMQHIAIKTSKTASMELTEQHNRAISVFILCKLF